jgi:hypothetical protein
MPGTRRWHSSPRVSESRNPHTAWIRYKCGRSAIGTLVERQCRYLMLLHLPNGRSAQHFRTALARQITSLPEQLRRTLTWDQGKEMADHIAFVVDTGVQVYFCDPHSPWQRGSSENTNGLLRQYFPRGKDLSLYDAKHLTMVAGQMNGRPRQTLGRHQTCHGAYEEGGGAPKRRYAAGTVMTNEGLPIQVARRVLAVSESGYYAWRSRAPSRRAAHMAPVVCMPSWFSVKGCQGRSKSLCGGPG